MEPPVPLSQSAGTGSRAQVRLTCADDLQRRRPPGPWTRVGSALVLTASTLLAGASTPLAEVIWSADQRLTSDPANPANPAVAADLNGNVYAVWDDDLNPTAHGREIYCAHSDGVTWSTGEQLTHHPHLSHHPDITSDLEGNAHVVWDDNRESGAHNFEIYYKRWDGLSWTTGARATDDGASSNMARIAAGPDSSLHLVWVDDRDGNWEIYYKRWNGNSWTIARRLTNDPADSWNPAVAAAPDGTVHVAWEDRRNGDWDIYHAQLTGGSWASPARLTAEPSDSRLPSIAADQSGGAHVVWTDDRDGNSEIYYKQGTGLTWAAETRLTDEEARSWRPQVCTAADSMIHVVWSDDRDGNLEIYYKGSDALEWSPDERLTDDGATSNSTRVASGPDGTIHVVWRDYRDDGAQIYHKQGAYEARRKPMPSGDELLAVPSGDELLAVVLSLAPGETTSNTIRSGAGDNLLFGTEWRTGSLELSLREPTGRVITPDAAAVDPDIEYVEASGLASYVIRCPQAGDWVITAAAGGSQDSLAGRLVAVEYADGVAAQSCDRSAGAAAPPLSLSFSRADKFSPATTFTFSIARRGPARLSIYGYRGRLVARPFDRRAALGDYEVVWDGLSQRGETLPSGVYLYRLKGDGETLVGRMVLLNSEHIPSTPGDDIPDPSLIFLPGPW